MREWINMDEHWHGSQPTTDQEVSLDSCGLCPNYPNTKSLSFSICKLVKGHC